MLGPRQQTSSRPYFLSVFYWGTVFFSFRLALGSGAILSLCSFLSASLPLWKGNSQVRWMWRHACGQKVEVKSGGRREKYSCKEPHKVLWTLHRNVKKQWSWPNPITQDKTDGLPESRESETGRVWDVLWRHLLLRLKCKCPPSPKAFKKITNEGEGKYWAIVFQILLWRDSKLAKVEVGRHLLSRPGEGWWAESRR